MIITRGHGGQYFVQDINEHFEVYEGSIIRRIWSKKKVSVFEWEPPILVKLRLGKRFCDARKKG